MSPTSGPLVVQSDKTLLLEIDHPDADACRMAIAPFAELERAPEHIHTYRLTPLGLWNARAAGHDAEQVVDTLLTYSRYPVPSSLLVDVADTMDRFGRLRLEKHPLHGLVLVCTDRAVLTEVLRSAKVKGLVGARLDDDTVAVHPSERGHLKQVLLKLGWPAEDLAGYVNGEAHEIALVQNGWELRPYQRQAADSFWHGGSGVVVLPCGAGKTVVGAASMAHAQATTLILVTNTVSARQWRDELLRRTTLTDDEIGEYSGARKQIRPVTIATYQVITTKRGGVHPHLELFSARDWGLVIYDEVHLLPAPVFRMTADLQARRRLGLTATLVREDGREGDVFSLIGPKRYDAPWKDIEAQGYIAPADCVEVRVTLSEPERMTYAVAEPDVKYRLASTAESKSQVVIDLVAKHRGVPILVIGQYVDQLEDLAARLGRTADHRSDDGPAAGAAVRGVPVRGDRSAGGQQGGQLLHRPAQRAGRHPGLRRLRLPPGGGPATGPPAATQGGGHHRPVPGRGGERHRGRRLRRSPAAVPGRAGLCVHDHGRRRRGVIVTGVVNSCPGDSQIRCPGSGGGVRPTDRASSSPCAPRRPDAGSPASGCG